MSDDLQLQPKLRIFLWTSPRSLSTVFTKCMSFVDGVQIIKEPFTAAHCFGPESGAAEDEGTTTFMKTVESKTPAQAAAESNAFDDSLATFSWIKGLLEAPYPGKSFVFCHDQAYGPRGVYERLPRGYRHTFLIRHPHKVFPSWERLIKKLFPSLAGIPFKDHPEMYLPARKGFGNVYDLMTYVQEELGESPIIVDADDLQRNPKSILRQYCTLLGIEFQESMLKWEAGNKIVDNWISSITILQGSKIEEGGFFDEAFKSTEFHPLKEMPSRDQLDPDLLPLVDFCLPIYEKMYSMRIRP